MIARQVGVWLCFLALAGCAALDTVTQYSHVKFADYKDGRDDWRIFDKPSEGRLMITYNVERAAGPAFGQGTNLPKPRFQNAVEAWLTSTGRMCRITNGYPLVSAQWEFKYSCA